MVQSITDVIGRFTGNLSETRTAASDPSARRKPDAALSVDFSFSHHVFGAVEDFFNQGNSDRLNASKQLSPSDREQFLKIVAGLLSTGYMGYEELWVNNKIERHDLDMQIGDERLRNARLYKDPKGRR